MAIFRLEAGIIQRSQGRSSTASAAYRAAECIEDERTGLSFDYSRRRGVVHDEIITPPHTPEWMQDRTQLWNAVERIEKRKDAQLAREILLSLPHELTHAQRVELVQGFAREEFVARGMIADVAIHAPHRQADPRNHHAHVLLTMRDLTGEGFGNKQRAWNETALLEHWREQWAQNINRQLEQHGHEARVDHRSLVAQGSDREPEPKQGPIATTIERQARASHAGDDRRAAQQRNEEREAMAAELATISAEIIQIEKAQARAAGQGTMSDTTTAEEVAKPTINTTTARHEPVMQDQLTPDDARAPEQRARLQAEQQVRQAEQMKELRDCLIAFEAEQKRKAEDAQQEEQRKREAEARGQAAEGEIHNAGDRYRIALGQQYDMRDPYGSLARAAMAEYGIFIKERVQLTEQIAKEQDPALCRGLEMRRDIEAADYMAITSHRIAGQSEVITGRNDSEEATRFRERAAAFETQAKDLRQSYRDHATTQASREAEATRDDERTARTAQNDNGRDQQQAGQDKPKEKTSDEKDADAKAHEATKGEVSDAKAARIAQITERGEKFESEQKTRQNSQPHDRGGGNSR